MTKYIYIYIYIYIYGICYNMSVYVLKSNIHTKNITHFLNEFDVRCLKACCIVIKYDINNVEK